MGYNIGLFVGSGLFYLMLFPLIFWCVDKSIGKRILTITLLGTFVSIVLKNLWMRPRPTGDLNDYGFPSSYVMRVTIFWGYIFSLNKKIKWGLITLFFIIFVATSRFFLEFNFFIDILFGIIFSIIILILFMIFEPKITTTCNETYTLLQRLLFVCFTTGGAIVLMIIVGIDSSFEILTVIGCFFGGMIGIILEKEHLGFSVNGTFILKVSRYLSGMLILFFLYYGLFSVLDLLNLTNSFFYFIVYALIAFVATYAIPKLFVILNLLDV